MIKWRFVVAGSGFLAGGIVLALTQDTSAGTPGGLAIACAGLGGVGVVLLARSGVLS